MRILLTGSSGFVGKALSTFLQKNGHEVFRLVRDKTARSDSHSFFWDPKKEEIDPSALQNIGAVINLAGENIFTGRWTKQRKQEILQSRIQATKTLVSAAKKTKTPPSIWIQASAVGFYGDADQKILGESSPRGQGFLASVCQDWENSLEGLSSLPIRIVILRLGVILHPSGGMLAKLTALFKWGLGARLGSGNQWMSWIALDDLLSLFLFALNHPDMRGVYNACAPNPITNREFTDILGKALHRPTFLPLPAWLLRLLFGRQKADELFLSSIRITPKKLQELKFSFAQPNIAPLL